MSIQYFVSQILLHLGWKIKTVYRNTLLCGNCHHCCTSIGDGWSNKCSENVTTGSNDRVGGRRLRVLRRSTGEVGMYRSRWRNDSLVFSSRGSRLSSEFHVICERSGDAARMYVGKRSSATGGRTGMGKVFTRRRICMVDVTKVYVIGTLHSKHASTER